MRLVRVYSHHEGADILGDARLLGWLNDLFEEPDLIVGGTQTSGIRDCLRTKLEEDGWAIDVRIDADSNLKVFARKTDLVFQLQTGNICRYAYDLLKFQHLYAKDEIEGAILAIPTKNAASDIGSNITNEDRVRNELSLFGRFITIPIIVISFE